MSGNESRSGHGDDAISLRRDFSVYAAFSAHLDRAMVETGISTHYDLKIGSSVEGANSVIKRLNKGTTERPGPYGGFADWTLIGIWRNSKMTNPQYPYDDRNFKIWAAGRFKSIFFKDFRGPYTRIDVVRLTLEDMTRLDAILADMRRSGSNDPLNEEIVRRVKSYISALIAAELKATA